MTCIVGVQKGGKVWLGGDSAASSRSMIEVISTPKVFKRGRFIYGFSGDYRTGQIVQHAFKEPDRRASVDPTVYMSTTYVDALRKQLAHSGALANDNGAEEANIWLLIGYAGELFYLDNGFAILRFAADYSAIGSGSDFALGALAATPNMPPALRVRRALEAAARHDPHVRPPFVTVSL